VRPHPAFVGREIPREQALGPFRLRWLTPEDLEEDYRAVMESAEALSVRSVSGWPVGLTKEADAVDLAWHRREFEALRSFAWVVEDEGGAYLGCAYVYLDWSPEGPMLPVWWFRTSVAGRVDEADFRARFLDWISGPPWPALAIREETPV
jgi:hypothetical protein